MSNLAYSLQKQLHDQGVPCHVDLRDCSLKKKLKDAAREKQTHVIILFPEKMVVRDMGTGEQQEVPYNDPPC